MLPLLDIRVFLVKFDEFSVVLEFGEFKSGVTVGVGGLRVNPGEKQGRHDLFDAVPRTIQGGKMQS